MDDKCENCKKVPNDYFIVEEPGWGDAYLFCSAECIVEYYQIKTGKILNLEGG